MWLKSIRGEHVALTGSAWLTRSELKRVIRRRGGVVTGNGEVTGITTVLVRGESSAWAYGDYGRKERRAAELVRQGHRIDLVHDHEFRKLVEHGKRARISDHIAGEFQWLSSVSRRRFETAASIEGPLDREHSALGRVEQSYLRFRLFGGAEESNCSLCGRRLPTGLLVAAHIKPRSDCSRSERLDADNIVFGLCLLGCDALYERGFVAVGPKRKLLVTGTSDSQALREVLKRIRGRACGAWNEANAKYFKWHVAWRFQGLKK